jgi:type II secretory pathway pseudopilin PulG
MDVQTLVVVAIVAGAAAYLLLRWRRGILAARAARDGACGSDCGCSKR